MATKAVRVTISGFLRGQFVQNVLHYKNIEATATTDFLTALNLADSWITEVGPYWLDSLPVDYIGSSVRAQVINTTAYPGTGPTVTAQVGFNGEPGTRSGTIAVTSIGPILVFPFEVSGKPRTGKVFLPGVTETDVNNNVLQSTLLTQLVALEGRFITPIGLTGTDTYQYAVYSPTDTEIYIPLGAYVSTQVGSIRNRQRPHG